MRFLAVLSVVAGLVAAAPFEEDLFSIPLLRTPNLSLPPTNRLKGKESLRW